MNENIRFEMVAALPAFQSGCAGKDHYPSEAAADTVLRLSKQGKLYGYGRATAWDEMNAYALRVLRRLAHWAQRLSETASSLRRFPRSSHKRRMPPRYMPPRKYLPAAVSLHSLAECADPAQGSRMRLDHHGKHRGVPLFGAP